MTTTITWLPFPDFRSSVRALSDLHLTKQRLDVLALLEYLHDVDISELPSDYQREKLYDHSPVILMWRGFEVQLSEYGLVACEEYAVRHGHADELYDKIAFHLECSVSESADMSKPNWFADVDFHISHQANLVQLDKVYYAELFKISGAIPLVWPVSSHVEAS